MQLVELLAAATQELTASGPERRFDGMRLRRNALRGDLHSHMRPTLEGKGIGRRNTKQARSEADRRQCPCLDLFIYLLPAHVPVAREFANRHVCFYVRLEIFQGLALVFFGLEFGNQHVSEPEAKT